MTYPKWFKKDGIPKLFNAQPTEVGWEPAGGHYDFGRGVWVDDEPEEAAPEPESAPESEETVPDAPEVAEEPKKAPARRKTRRRAKAKA